MLTLQTSYTKFLWEDIRTRDTMRGKFSPTGTERLESLHILQQLNLTSQGENRAINVPVSTGKLLCLVPANPPFEEYLALRRLQFTRSIRGILPDGFFSPFSLTRRRAHLCNRSPDLLVLNFSKYSSNDFYIWPTLSRCASALNSDLALTNILYIKPESSGHWPHVSPPPQ